jgi:hypothetical protein
MEILSFTSTSSPREAAYEFLKEFYLPSRESFLALVLENKEGDALAKLYEESRETLDMHDSAELALGTRFQFTVFFSEFRRCFELEVLEALELLQEVADEKLEEISSAAA